MGLILLSIVLIVLAVLFLTERDASPTRLKDFTVFWIFLGMFISLGAMVVEHLSINLAFSWLAFFGSVLFVLGAVIRFIGRRTLGKFFTYEVKVQQKHKLITSGIYQYIRHPLYTRILLLWFGAAILLQSITGFILILLILVPALWYRMKIEETFLIKEFGKRYQHYMNATKRLVPVIY